MPITREFTVYLNTGVGIAPFINANQYDSGETWIFTILTDSGVQYTPSSVSIIGKKPDGNTIDVAGTVSDGKAVIVETEQMTACVGIAVFELHIDNDHGTANFKVNVEESPIEGGTASESELTLIQQAVDAADRIAMYGSPLQANSLSDMTNENSVYVYTGTTTASLTNGHWYFYDGEEWTDGGVYNAVAINTDTTLTQPGVAADAKATGDAIENKFILSSEISEVLTG